MDPIFFASSEDLRTWFLRHHRTSSELWVGFFKKGSKPRGVTYAEALEEALCFGWIDTTVRRVDALRYAHRFVPRRARSAWTETNVALARELIRARRMRAAGRQAFAVRVRSPRARKA